MKRFQVLSIFLISILSLNLSAVISHAETKKYNYIWSAELCDEVGLKLNVLVDHGKMGIFVTNPDTGQSWDDGIEFSDSKNTFNLNISADYQGSEFLLKFKGYATPNGGKANAFNDQFGCGADANLVLVKD